MTTKSQTDALRACNLIHLLLDDNPWFFYAVRYWLEGRDVVLPGWAHHLLNLGLNENYTLPFDAIRIPRTFSDEEVANWKQCESIMIDRVEAEMDAAEAAAETAEAAAEVTAELKNSECPMPDGGTPGQTHMGGTQAPPGRAWANRRSNCRAVTFREAVPGAITARFAFARSLALTLPGGALANEAPLICVCPGRDEGGRAQRGDAGFIDEGDALEQRPLFSGCSVPSHQHQINGAAGTRRGTGFYKEGWKAGTEGRRERAQSTVRPSLSGRDERDFQKEVEPLRHKGHREEAGKCFKKEGRRAGAEAEGGARIPNVQFTMTNAGEGGRAQRCGATVRGGPMMTRSCKRGREGARSGVVRRCAAVRR